MPRLDNEALAALEQHGGNFRRAAAAQGLAPSTFQNRVQRARKRLEFVSDPLPAEGRDIDDLLCRRLLAFDRKEARSNARTLIPVAVRMDGPIGILHMGDPHLDDDGCDLRTLMRHVQIANDTPGMMAGNVGDATNNWVGRLGRLYGQQSSTAAEGWQLAEWFVRSTPWLYLIGGNHDAWSGPGDPLRWIADQAGVQYEMHGARLALHLPGGREIRVNGRHDFLGHSQWNPAHGPGKAAQMGPDDHIFVCGHKHVFGMGWHKRAAGQWACALRVGTYKRFDNYAAEKGFPDHNLPAVVTLIFPDAADPSGLIEVVKDVDRAADFLTWARARHASGRSAKAEDLTA